MHRIVLFLFVIHFELHCSLPFFQQEQKQVSIDQARIIVRQSMGAILRKMLIKHPIYGGKCERSPVAIDALPFWLIKTNVTRLQGAAILNACIKERNLESMYIPYKEKFDVDINGLWIQEELDGIYVPKELCIVEKVFGGHGSMFSKRHTEQVIDLIKYAEKPYIDWHKTNTVFMPDGRVALIDTEIGGFYTGTKNDRLRALLYFQRWNDLDDDASDLLKKHIDDMRD